MLYSSFWRVGVNTNRSAAQPPSTNPLPFNRAGSNSSRDGVMWWENVLPPSLELPIRTKNTQLAALPPVHLPPPPLLSTLQPSRRQHNDSPQELLNEEGEKRKVGKKRKARHMVGGREVNMRACELKRKSERKQGSTRK